MKNIWVWIGLLFLGGFVFWLTTLNPLNPDTWFHLASGRVLLHEGLIHYDVFSQAGTSRGWIPYEWMFQIILYAFTTVGIAPNIFVGIIACIQVSILYVFVKKIIGVNHFFSLCLCLFYILLVNTMFVARPQIVASTLFIAEIFIIVFFFVKDKNFLLLLLPLTYIWANLHASVILSVVYVFLYCVVSGYIYLRTKEKLWLQKTKNLALSFLGVCFVSILFPQGIMQYQYLLLFVHNSYLVTRNIREWMTLTTFLGDTVLYSCITVSLLILLFIKIYKEKSFMYELWILPIILLIPYGYVALRNTYFGYFAAVIVLAVLCAKIKIYQYTLPAILSITTVLVGLYSFLLWINFERLQSATTDFPSTAAAFIQKQHVQGNMFNQYNYGGYLEYELFPQEKVFIDGRTDVFLCCELPEYFLLQDSINLSDNKFDSLITKFFNMHKISYALLEVKKDPFGWKVAHVLQNDKNWSLVYWDDRFVIFVKNNEENNSLIRSFGAVGATPFEEKPFREGQAKQAYSEYTKMVGIVDSAISRNALGYLYFLSGDLSSAKEQFQKAIALDSTYESGYSNLAEVMVKEQNYSEAIALYTQALTLNPNRPIIYLRLGQLYHATHDDANAKTIWEQGLSHIQDPQYKVLLEKYIQSLEN